LIDGHLEGKPVLVQPAEKETPENQQPVNIQKDPQKENES